MIWERKEKEGRLAHPDTQGLLDLMEPLDIPEAPDPQVSTGFPTPRAGSKTLSMALTSWNHLCGRNAI